MPSSFGAPWSPTCLSVAPRRCVGFRSREHRAAHRGHEAARRRRRSGSPLDRPPTVRAPQLDGDQRLMGVREASLQPARLVDEVGNRHARTVGRDRCEPPVQVVRAEATVRPPQAIEEHPAGHPTHVCLNESRLNEAVLPFLADALFGPERVSEEREHRLVEPGLVQADVGGVAGGMFFDRLWGPDRGFSPDHLHRWLTAITANRTGMTVADLVDEARRLEARLPHTHQALIPVQLRRTNRRRTVKRRSGPATPSGGLVAAMSGPVLARPEPDAAPRGYTEARGRPWGTERRWHR